MQAKHQGPITYFVHGDNPKLLILSGTHGDEFEAAMATTRAVEAYADKLPSFVFIPQVSPSAVLSKTRVNGNQLDLNRSFFDDGIEPEVIAIMKIVRQYQFDLCIDFHEEPVYRDFYFYDSGEMDPMALTRLKNNISNLDIGLFTGIDDPDDVILTNKIEDGYSPNSLAEYSLESGMFEVWAVKNRLVKRSMVMEIPESLTTEKKQSLVHTLFEDLVLPFFS